MLTLSSHRSRPASRSVRQRSVSQISRPRTTRRCRQGRLRDTAHLEPLPSPRRTKNLPNFEDPAARRPGLTLYYQCCDYATVPRRHPCRAPPNRGWLVPGPSRGSRSHMVLLGAAGGGVCGAKRIRSIYFPRPTGRPPDLSTTTPLTTPASLSTINAATMRLCRADLPATNRPADSSSPEGSLD